MDGGYHALDSALWRTVAGEDVAGMWRGCVDEMERAEVSASMDGRR